MLRGIQYLYLQPDNIKVRVLPLAHHTYTRQAISAYHGPNEPNLPEVGVQSRYLRQDSIKLREQMILVEEYTYPPIMV